MTAESFVCRDCGSSFSIKAEILAKYPGWKPAQCMSCKNSKKGKAGAKNGAKKTGKRRPRRPKAMEENLTREQVLERYTGGPLDGVFTDGACTGNPGPGGWGMVHVRDNEVIAEDCGHDPQTTNNRMELAALIAAYEYLPVDAEEVIWSDSNLCVRTINEWAAGWKRLGWKRKTGPVENLELVKKAYQLSLNHQKVELRWIKAHNGSRWNEYADSLATSYTRNER